MTESEWLEFLSTGAPLHIKGTRLPRELCRVIGASADRVLYRHDYAMKAMLKHRLQPYHFPMLPITIDLGRVVTHPDKPLHLHFFYREDVVFGKWFKVVVKTNAVGDDLFVTTFHRVRPEEAERWFKNYLTIRPMLIT